MSLFKNLFRGREDVYAIRWEGKRARRAIRRPVTANGTGAATGRGPKKQFRITKLFALSDETIRGHLLGKQTIGVYPLLTDDTCWFVAVDFDKKSWEADACAILTRTMERRYALGLDSYDR